MNFDEENRKDWIHIHQQIFPLGIPLHCEWKDRSTIINIINAIGSKDNSNHMFYPTGGGMDVESAKPSNEEGCIELFTGLHDVFKPTRMLFESFDDPMWNYFRLELSEMEPFESGSERGSEMVTEVEEGKYISGRYWDQGEYMGEPLPKTARPVTRHLRGSFVIFAKASFYNRHSSTYDARHNKMSAEEFRRYLENVMQHGWKD